MLNAYVMPTPLLPVTVFGSVGTYMQELLQAMGLRGIHIRTKPNPGFLDSIPQPNERNMAPVSKLTAQKMAIWGCFSMATAV